MANLRVTDKLISASLITQINKITPGRFFETCWAADGALAEALLRWTAARWPRWHEQAEGDAAMAEAIIRDEEGGDELADFVNGLPAALQRDALEALCNLLRDQPQAKAARLAERLDKLLAKLPAPTVSETSAALLQRARAHLQRLEIDPGIAAFSAEA